ncbi:hypothetical protein ACQ4PT_071214 [Festuca glaucescens]
MIPKPMNNQIVAMQEGIASTATPRLAAPPPNNHAITSSLPKKLRCRRNHRRLGSTAAGRGNPPPPPSTREDREAWERLEVDRASEDYMANLRRNNPERVAEEAVTTTASTSPSSTTRLNVVQSRAQYANGDFANSEQSRSSRELLETHELEDNEDHLTERDDNLDNMTGDGKAVDKRGAHSLPAVWNMPDGARIVVKCNNLGQPIGDEGGVLGKFLGTIARLGGYCPLDKKDWRNVKKDGGADTILQCVQADLADLEKLIHNEPELAQSDHGKVAWKGDALHTILGEEKPGQVHGMGLLPVPNQVYGRLPRYLKNINMTTTNGSSHAGESDVMEEIAKLKRRIEEQDQRIEEQDQIIEGFRNQDEANFRQGNDESQPEVPQNRRKRVHASGPEQVRLVSRPKDTIKIEKFSG